MTFMRSLAITLMVIGAINWGLIGFFQIDLVATLFGGQDSFLSRIIYGLVGLSAIYYVLTLFTAADIIDQNSGDKYIDKKRKLKYQTEYSDESELTDPRVHTMQTREEFSERVTEKKED